MIARLNVYQRFSCVHTISEQPDVKQDVCIIIPTVNGYMIPHSISSHRTQQGVNVPAQL